MFTTTVSEKILFFICGFGILQGLLLAALLYFHHNSDRKVNIYLALYIFCTSVIMGVPFFLKLIGWQNSYFIMPFPVLAGPLLYLYLLSFKQAITWKTALPHFVLFFIFFFIIRWNISVISQQYPGAREVPPDALRRPVTLILSLARTIQQLIYFYFARKTLLSYQHAIRHLFSDTSRIDLSWAKFLVNGYLFLVVTFIIIFPLILRFPAYFNVLLLLNMAVGTPYLYIASYRGFRQLTIWQAQPGLTQETVEEEISMVEKIETKENEKPKIAKAGLGADKIDDIVKKINSLMNDEKLYQETELTLQQLAAKLQVPNYQVSQALNDGMKKSFYDLINGYRVEEAKRLLLNPKNRSYTILSVGFEAGFNSKTTFNTVFKKFSGLTPTEFREKHNALAAVQT